MNRRDFMQCMGIGALATSLPVAIAACTPNANKPSGVSSGSASGPTENPSQTDSSQTDPSQTADKTNTAGKYIILGTLAELNQKGYLTSTDAITEPVIAIQDPTNRDGVIALSSKCTHNGCEVAWQEDLFACPCHGSKFNPDGTVVEGPATQALTPFSAKIENETVLVVQN